MVLKLALNELEELNNNDAFIKVIKSTIDETP